MAEPLTTRLRRGKEAISRWGRVVPLLQKELQSPISVPLGTRLGMWRRGFLSESQVIYGLDRNDPAEYLSDFARFVRTPGINGNAGRILDHKLAFHQVLGAFPQVVPRTFALIEKGQIIPLKYPGQARCEASIVDLVRSEGKVVLKPMGGGGGKGIRMVEWGEGQFHVNGKAESAAALAGRVRRLDRNLIVAFVPQHPALADIYPAATSTTRILTIWDGDSFVAAAVQRIGNSRSQPVDNWTRGGTSSQIDLETGRLGKAVSYPANGRLEWHERHPETGRPIAGMVLPHWQRVRDGILEICQAVPYLKYVGWDVVITEDGFRILEGNNYTDVNLLQVHQPLLANPRLKAFYRRHGVIS